MKSLLFVIFSGLLFSFHALAQAPEVGRDAAARYFEKPVESGENRFRPQDHYLAIHYGRFMNAQSWDWGQKGREDKTGSNNYGLTYRVSEWNNAMDWSLRVDFTEYNVAGERPLKMSLLPVLTFPDASSRFPLYFGAGAGLGIFFKQIDGESPLSFDYQLMMGARFFNIFENVGFFIETGMKNHLLLTSSGQFNGVYLSGGAVFTF
ncbi:MAG: acyloxyacyl hydrolase [Bdellovibrionaceae bacterium]|nr:acyloxyacyl hydrolase [Pseudobdellovibrionaceae bacterium]